MREQMIPHEYVVKNFYYCPSTGKIWRLANNKHGKPSHYNLTATPQASTRGRATVRINGFVIQAHRLAWCYVHGEWPNGHIDHINGNPSDNRICNLRVATNMQNMENLRKPTARSTTGLLGVVNRKTYFEAIIQVKGKQTRIGSYKTPEEAHVAYVEAKRILHEYCTI